MVSITYGWVCPCVTAWKLRVKTDHLFSGTSDSQTLPNSRSSSAQSCDYLAESETSHMGVFLFCLFNCTIWTSVSRMLSLWCFFDLGFPSKTCTRFNHYDSSKTDEKNRHKYTVDLLFFKKKSLVATRPIHLQQTHGKHMQFKVLNPLMIMSKWKRKMLKSSSVFQASRWSTKWTQAFVLEKGTKPFTHAVFFSS